MFWLLLIAIFLVIILVVYISIPWAENKFLFCPSNKTSWRPDIPYENVYIDIKNPSLVHHMSSKHGCNKYIHGWHFNNFPGHKTVMFCHGNSGNISYRKYIVDICQKFNLNLLIFDYRGFGRSSGKPSKHNLKQDGTAAYKYLTEYCDVDPYDLIICGESLGGVPAISTASKYPCRSLILLSTFSGLGDAATYYFNQGVSRSLAYGFSSLASLRFDLVSTKNYMKKVKCPVAILHSTEDNIIPYKCAKILYKSIKHRSKVLIPIHGKHSAPDISKEALNKLFMFCDVSLPGYEKVCDVDWVLKDLQTVAERYHNFIDK